jgi:beta-lactamase superfamily II metal-dependent hydrolase
VIAASSYICTCIRKDSRKDFFDTSFRITEKYEHPDLQHPVDVARFKGKYVITELYRNRLAISDDLGSGEFYHFDPKTIGKHFHSPHFLTVTPWDTLLISNGWGCSIIEIEDLDGKGWKEFKGVGKRFRAPHGICVDDDGWIYVGDSLNSRLVRFKDIQGKDWQVFHDLDRRIAYIREMVCQNKTVWISNSYENREGLNSGQGGNILKLSNFESGKLEVVSQLPETNITGLLVADNFLITNSFAKKSLHVSKLGGHQDEALEFIKSGATGLGVPYGTFAQLEQEAFLVAFFGEFKPSQNQGGILEIRKVTASTPDKFIWTMINVNATNQQGDAHLLQVVGGKTILIDTGFPNITEQVVVPYLKMNGISKLDSVFITHAHKDHYGGLKSIHEADIEIKRAYFNPLNESMCAREKRCDFEEYGALQQFLRKNGTEVFLTQTGDVFELGWHSRLKVLYAFDGIKTPANTVDVNNTSSILMVEHAGYKLLFTGDLGKGMGQYFTQNNINVKADVLKVPHHGTEGLAANTFFAKVAPRYAMIPAPKHLWLSDRSKRVREWFEAQKIPAYVNGISGHVQVVIQNNQLSIIEEHPRTEQKNVNICKIQG